jgi:hypothetical protein
MLTAVPPPVAFGTAAAIGTAGASCGIAERAAAPGAPLQKHPQLSTL